ncbi:hypothetical protein [Fibrivirga algicola]|uniref:Uncharacterized protein n=1 Tax=Fibrivirga algicola TaxID=2950420 RepID=A0ABX0QFP8_9BACT|nr:hypothetical protein [Fibrivirga algicola]NID09558.1 hypothetical protein [Fibrivirga algicola]
MRLEKNIRLPHVWFRLAAGIAVFISIRGCLHACQEKIQNATQPFRYVDARQAAFLPPSKLQAIATAPLPGKPLNAVLFSGPEKAAQAIFLYFDPSYFLVYLNLRTEDLTSTSLRITQYHIL